MLPPIQDIAERFGDQVHLSCHGFDDDAEMHAVLAKHGIPIPEKWSRDDSVVTDSARVLVEAIATIDRVTLRALTKIALNYIDAVFPTLSRLPRFASTAAFVRDDARGPSPAWPVAGGILADERDGSRRLGHVVLVRHDGSSGVTTGKVSLFNQLVYEVTLATDPFLIAVPAEVMTSGHFFDIKNGAVLPLSHGSDAENCLLIRHQP